MKQVTDVIDMYLTSLDYKVYVIVVTNTLERTRSSVSDVLIAQSQQVYIRIKSTISNTI